MNLLRSAGSGQAEESMSDRLPEPFAPIIRQDAWVDELLEIAATASVDLTRPYADHAELLYDDNGLPI